MTSDDYRRDCIRVWIKSGCYTPEQVFAMLNDDLEEENDADGLREFVRVELNKHDDDELSWPQQTDCDRIDRAFLSLSSQGVVALQHAGQTMASRPSASA